MTTEDGETTETWIRETCLDRLDGNSSGLSEVVLCAAVVHRAPPELGVVVAADVKKALKGLLEIGRVAYSAGRWRMIR